MWKLVTTSKVLAIMRRTHGILDHHQHFLKSPGSGGFRNDGQGRHLSELVFGKADSIQQQFSDVFEKFDWALEMVTTVALKYPDAESASHRASELLLLAVEVTGHHSAAYYRRITTPCRRLCLSDGRLHL